MEPFENHLGSWHFSSKFHQIKFTIRITNKQKEKIQNLHDYGCKRYDMCLVDSILDRTNRHHKRRWLQRIME